MPTFQDVTVEIDKRSLTEGGAVRACNKVRQKYIKTYSRIVGRPVIAYYSAFLQKQPNGQIHPECAISDLDMNGMMAVVNRLDRTKGLDLILHTPGGGIEAARGIVEYLYKMFGHDIRVIVPQMAMSSGTMIACASREIVMGSHSCLGPTDPQVRGLPAMGILNEVDRAINEIKADPAKQIFWQEVFRRYMPSFIGDCERSVEGTREMVAAWLAGNMLKDKADPRGCADTIVGQLMNYNGTTEHGQHFLSDRCKSIGLNVRDLEENQAVQDAVLSLHHAFVISFSQMSAIKIIENSIDARWVVNGN